MKVLLLFLAVSILIGGTDLGRWWRERPVAMMVVAVTFAASYWSLGVVLG